jgi:hypothetical protein
MELFEFIRRLEDRGILSRVANSPLIQFGPPSQPFIGATLLPERTVTENSFRDTEIRYRSFVANDGTRFSPVQLKRGGRLVGSMLVELGNQDIGAEFTGREYDAWVTLLNRNATQEAMLQIIGWVENSLVRPLAVKNELQRWQAIVDAQVPLVGDNGYIGMVNFPNPVNHRVTAGGDWSDNTYDPMDDIKGQAQVLYDKGYAVSRSITSMKVVGILTKNAKIAQRAKGNILVIGGGALETMTGQVTLADINNMMAAEGMPALTINDQRYDTPTGSKRFMPDDVFVMVATTGVTVPVDIGGDEGQRILQDTLGYVAIGRAAGQAAPGRVTLVTPYRNKPPRIEGEGWQTSFPVMSQPEAVTVISGIQ